MSEKHSKSFEYFDLHVDVTDEGDVRIELAFPEPFSTLALHWDDLREMLDFAAVHGLGMKEPYVVEYRDTREAIEA